MLTVFLHREGRTTVESRLDAAWLRPEGGGRVWADLAAPTPDEVLVLAEVFGFHGLAIEDALSAIHHPKVETYDGYLYAILHGIDFEASARAFSTHDVDFFLGPTYLVTVHDGRSRSIAGTREACARNPRLMEDLALLMHRIVDAMVDSYAPEVDRLEDRLEALEREVIEQPSQQLVPAILALKRDVLALRRVTSPQRDVINRFARRDFPQISHRVAYEFRDVYDHLVRIADESLMFQDRVTGLLEAHLTSVSNRLNRVMQLLTVITTILLPPTLLASLYGMNVPLPRFPGGDAAQFWWITAIMLVTAATMLAFFRTRRWL